MLRHIWDCMAGKFTVSVVTEDNKTFRVRVSNRRGRVWENTKVFENHKYTPDSAEVLWKETFKILRRKNGKINRTEWLPVEVTSEDMVLNGYEPPYLVENGILPREKRYETDPEKDALVFAGSEPDAYPFYS
jgi:CYTH domain-containing protein